jgi:hypothetical protein
MKEKVVNYFGKTFAIGIGVIGTIACTAIGLMLGINQIMWFGCDHGILIFVIIGFVGGGFTSVCLGYLMGLRQEQFIIAQEIALAEEAEEAAQKDRAKKAAQKKEEDALARMMGS